MSDKIPKQLIIVKGEDGVEYSTVNPEYEEYVKKEKYKIRLKRSNIPSSYHDLEFDHYLGDKESISYKQIAYYAQHCYEPTFNNVNIYIFGLHSCQKTTMACNVLKESIRMGKEARFILAGDLIDLLMKNQGFNKDQETRKKLKDLKEADIICIDDTFDPDKALMWKNSDNKNMIISEWDTFFRSVLSSKTKIVLTSNFNSSIIEQYYGKSLFELIERNFYFIELKNSVKNERKNKLSEAFKNIQ